MEWILGIAAGVLASLIAACLYDILKRMQHKVDELDIEGSWAEFVPDSAGRQFTHGQIYYDGRRKMYVFDGTNFKNDGTPFCHFETTASRIEGRKFLYIFTASIEGEPDRTYYGFGVVNLMREGGRLVPVDGHYVSDNIDDQGMAHSMLRVDDLPYSRSENGLRVIQRLQGADAA